MGGETSITTPEYTVIPYQLPNLVITSSNVKRNGPLTGKGLLNLIGTFYNATIGSKTNTITLSFAYWKAENTESTTYYAIPSSANKGSGNNISISNWNITKNETIITDLDKNYAYKFKIKAVDIFGNSSTIELICNKGEYIMCEYKDRVDFKEITKGNVKIVESGSNANGDWIKYCDGTMICTKKLEDVTNEISKTWGNLYESQSAIVLGSMPVTFTELKYINASLTSDNWHSWIVRHQGITTSDFGELYLARPTTGTVKININCIAIGKWK